MCRGRVNWNMDDETLVERYGTTFLRRVSVERHPKREVKRRIVIIIIWFRWSKRQITATQFKFIMRERNASALSQVTNEWLVYGTVHPANYYLNSDLPRWRGIFFETCTSHSKMPPPQGKRQYKTNIVSFVKMRWMHFLSTRLYSSRLRCWPRIIMIWYHWQDNVTSRMSSMIIPATWVVFLCASASSNQRRDLQ